MSYSIPNTITGLVSRIEEGTATLASIAMFLMMVVITVDTVMRYVFSNPIAGTHSIIELYLMPLLIFGIAAVLQREGGNINVDILRRRFGTRADHTVNLISRVGALAVFGIIAVLTMGQAVERFADDARLTGAIALPTAYSWLFISIGLAGLCVRFLIQIIDDITTIVRGEEPSEASDSESEPDEPSSSADSESVHTEEQ
ncbi:TRAP transporter small permease [Natrarchaeobius sp. A-rgal3]|uniref:TRAP transporter small permease n=1 Tax=Natrarchaeobius versutus TaxID=1679078 RepID=UPI00350FFD52